jgi:hypothetical protein
VPPRAGLFWGAGRGGGVLLGGYHGARVTTVASTRVTMARSKASEI